MIGTVTVPRAGETMKASWGAAVAAVVNGCAGTLNARTGATWPNRRERATPEPFTVRLTGETTTGSFTYQELEIYLPASCAVVGTACKILNEAVDGASDWYKIDGANYTGKEVVIAHIKERSYATSGETAGPILYVECAQVSKVQSTGVYGGDVASIQIASCSKSTADDGTATFGVKQEYTGNVVLPATTPRPFDIEWIFNPSNSPYTFPRITRRSLVLGGTTYTADALPNTVPQSTNIGAFYLYIDTSSSDLSLSLGTTYQKTTDDLTCIQLYELNANGVVTADCREQLANLTFYR